MSAPNEVWICVASLRPSRVERLLAPQGADAAHSAAARREACVSRGSMQWLIRWRRRYRQLFHQRDYLMLGCRMVINERDDL